MSESSNMGLFGSKDQDKESTEKKTSSDHCTPYNIDGGSGTYNTETLTIMDINDIIGVRSEHANDSTLESEIAALSEIITDSQSEPLQKISTTGTKDMFHKGSSVMDQSKVQTTQNSSSGEFSMKNNIKGSNPYKESNSKLTGPALAMDGSKPNSNINAERYKDISKFACIKRFDESRSKCHIPTLTGISQSLQLIGEAYTSEDSQESSEDETIDTVSIQNPKKVDDSGASKMVAVESNSSLENRVKQDSNSTAIESEVIKENNNSSQCNVVDSKSDDLKKLDTIDGAVSNNDSKTESTKVDEIKGPTTEIIKDSAIPVTNESSAEVSSNEVLYSKVTDLPTESIDSSEEKNSTLHEEPTQIVSKVDETPDLPNQEEIIEPISEVIEEKPTEESSDLSPDLQSSSEVNSISADDLESKNSQNVTLVDTMNSSELLNIADPKSENSVSSTQIVTEPDCQLSLQSLDKLENLESEIVSASESISNQRESPSVDELLERVKVVEEEESEPIKDASVAEPLLNIEKCPDSIVSNDVIIDEIKSHSLEKEKEDVPKDFSSLEINKEASEIQDKLKESKMEIDESTESKEESLNKVPEISIVENVQSSIEPGLSNVDEDPKHVESLTTNEPVDVQNMEIDHLESPENDEEPKLINNTEISLNEDNRLLTRTTSNENEKSFDLQETNKCEYDEKELPEIMEKKVHQFESEESQSNNEEHQLKSESSTICEVFESKSEVDTNIETNSQSLSKLENDIQVTNVETIDRSQDTVDEVLDEQNIKSPHTLVDETLSKVIEFKENLESIEQQEEKENVLENVQESIEEIVKNESENLIVDNSQALDPLGDLEIEKMNEQFQMENENLFLLDEPVIKEKTEEPQQPILSTYSSIELKNDESPSDKLDIMIDDIIDEKKSCSEKYENVQLNLPPDIMEIDTQDDDDFNVEDPIKSDIIEENIQATIESKEDPEIPSSLDSNEILLRDSLIPNESSSVSDIIPLSKSEDVENEEMFSCKNQLQSTQDIMTEILGDANDVSELKDILNSEENVNKEIEEALQANSPLGTGIDNLTEKLPQDSEDMLDKELASSMSTRNMDSLEGLLGLDLINEKETDDSLLAESKENSQDSGSNSKSVNIADLLEQSDQHRNYIDDVLNNCLPEEKVEIPKDFLTITENIGKDCLDDDLGMNFVEEEKTMETSQPSSEMSELESAVKFLQESEEQNIDSPLMLSPKMVESVENISKTEENDDLVTELQHIAQSSISISETEVISEAVKLENEKRFGQRLTIDPPNEEENLPVASFSLEHSLIKHSLSDIMSTINDIPLKVSETIPKTLKLEERLKEPPKIEIPVTDMTRVMTDSALTPKNTLLIQRDVRAKMLESPKMTDKTESKIFDSPRKDFDRHSDLESVGSPRIILKIAKSAITDCGEPRSPKSPKIRSAANSPNPDDSPGQKLQKIKLKLSKGGHPSIISNENSEDVGVQWHPESTGSSLSPLGMKIKLSKSGDASIVSTEKYDHLEERRTESPIGMKLKLSKSGDVSIVQQDSREISPKEGTKRTDSPLGMKFKLSKSGDASIIHPEKQETEDIKELFPKSKDSCQQSPKRTESPIGMKIKLSKSGDATIISPDSYEENKDKRLDICSEGSKKPDSPIGMKIKLSKTKTGASIITTESSLDKDKLEIPDVPKRTESPLGMKFKLSKSGDASIIHSEIMEPKETKKDEKDEGEGSQKCDNSSLGMKIKFSKSGDAKIVSSEVQEFGEEQKSMKIKFSKSGEAKIISSEKIESTEEPKNVMKIKVLKNFSEKQDQQKQEEQRTMRSKTVKSGDIKVTTIDKIEHGGEQRSVRIKMSKSGEISEEQKPMKIKISKLIDPQQSNVEKQNLTKLIDEKVVSSDNQESSSAEDERQKKSLDILQGQCVPENLDSIGDSRLTKIKLFKTIDGKGLSSVKQESVEEQGKCMKIKLSKSNDGLMVSSEDVQASSSKRTESPIGMKIKLSKTGDASIVSNETSEDTNLSKNQRKSETEKKSSRRKDVDSSLEMKIKLSKTGHPTIVSCDTHGDAIQKKAIVESLGLKYKDPQTTSEVKQPVLKCFKTTSPTAVPSNRTELTIEPVQSSAGAKRKDITMSPLEMKKSKLESQLSHMLPDVTIQPVSNKDKKQLLFDPKSNLISRQQMNVISREISITQVKPLKPKEPVVTGKLKELLNKNTTVESEDCHIIETRPEFVVVNENSNSNQDVMIIEEVASIVQQPEVKIPRKRGRPRKIQNQMIIQQPTRMPPQPVRDPLAFDEIPTISQTPETDGSGRPVRTCRSRKSYAPPKRGRGRGRGKRKLDDTIPTIGKKPRLDEDEISPIIKPTVLIDFSSKKSVEIFNTVEEPLVDSEISTPICEKISERMESKTIDLIDPSRMDLQEIEENILDEKSSLIETIDPIDEKTQVGDVVEIDLVESEQTDKPIEIIKDDESNKSIINETEKVGDLTETIEEKELTDIIDGNKGKELSPIMINKDTPHPPDPANWLTPTTSKKPLKESESIIKTENVSIVQMIDEETRMSAESGSRSQTPAKNISQTVSEIITNEESQGSVLSTATTESEKVKVKNRRMEINFDPDEGPFTVDKLVEYEWPLDRKSETFMIQEQISQYLGVKSFKRKYPDLRRRMVDMEERNYLRENALVSEAMCDMGLTAVCSQEVLDVMCNDFPDQYEEYRKYIRDKQAREHSRKQKELLAAANAERNRIDLAEMAVQSALSWNVNFNKARKDARRCSLDLQTFTIHVPKKQHKVSTESKGSHYPVALIPGQYTDFYREYTPAELRYYPLNTVLYGPMKPNERKFDSHSEGSQSDSDSDSSSDDSSSSSSEGTQDTEESQSTMDDVDMELVAQKEDSKLKCKMCLKALNKFDKNELLIQCGTCNGHVHPSCIDLTLDMVPHIRSYAWQCTDCKTCAQCHDPADEDKMLFCDMCDRGYHIYCVGLRRVPQGRWHCQECAVCGNCGTREPGGPNINLDKNNTYQWQHEYKRGEKNTRVYVSTFCVPCSKLWRKGRYCPHCSRCHPGPRLDLDASLVHCSACDKYLHLECVETKGMVLDRKNYLCDFCTPNRQITMKHLVSKVLRA